MAMPVQASRKGRTITIKVRQKSGWSIRSDTSVRGVRSAAKAAARAAGVPPAIVDLALLSLAATARSQAFAADVAEVVGAGVIARMPAKYQPSAKRFHAKVKANRPAFAKRKPKAKAKPKAKPKAKARGRR